MHYVGLVQCHCIIPSMVMLLHSDESTKKKSEQERQLHCTNSNSRVMCAWPLFGNFSEHLQRWCGSDMFSLRAHRSSSVNFSWFCKKSCSKFGGNLVDFLGPTNNGPKHWENIEAFFVRNFVTQTIFHTNFCRRAALKNGVRIDADSSRRGISICNSQEFANCTVKDKVWHRTSISATYLSVHLLEDMPVNLAPLHQNPLPTQCR